jgi:hypothetical protein
MPSDFGQEFDVTNHFCGYSRHDACVKKKEKKHDALI